MGGNTRCYSVDRFVDKSGRSFVFAQGKNRIICPLVASPNQGWPPRRSGRMLPHYAHCGHVISPQAAPQLTGTRVDTTSPSVALRVGV